MNAREKLTVKNKPSPGEAMARLTQFKRQLPDALCRSRDPHNMLRDLDNLGMGPVWRTRTPAILRHTLMLAGYEGYWRDGVSNGGLPGKVVQAVLDPHDVWRDHSMVRPMRDNSHGALLVTEKNLPLVAEVYQAAAYYNSPPALAAVESLMAHQPMRGEVHQRFNKLRNYSHIRVSLLEADSFELAHRIIRVESSFDDDYLRRDIHNLATKASLPTRSAVLFHYARDFQKSRHDETAALICEQAEELMQRDPLAKAEGIRAYLYASGARREPMGPVSPEGQYLGIVMHYASSLKRGLFQAAKFS